jgi:Disulphide bond corrector protein DsbC
MVAGLRVRRALVAELTVMIRPHGTALLAVALLAGSPPLGAQMRAPKAVLTPSADPAAVRPGKTAKLLLKVALPEKIHVQSNKPRDAAFFPTALVLTPPAGVTVTSTTYPAAVDFVQEGQAEPLAVFEKTFTVTATVAVAAAVKPGDVAVPGRFDYQACDDKVCYRPVKTDVRWTLTVMP